MVKSDETVIESVEHEDEEESINDLQDESSEENGEEEESKPRLPKWAKILLMILPAVTFATIIILVDQFVGFPENVSANAVIALTGIGLLGFVVIGDMLYRNIFVSRMLRRETKKSKIYREILDDKKKAKLERSRFDELDVDAESEDDEYSYEEVDDDEEFVDELESEEEFDEEDEEYYEEESEYQYDSEDDDESKYYRTKSLAVRGGIFSILIVNALIILGLAVIFQIALYGGFVITEVNETAT
ncbi:MAG: hypothetical protein ACTSO7_09530 [Candidatus Heimdallarchaeota archaeon]